MEFNRDLTRADGEARWEWGQGTWRRGTGDTGREEMSHGKVLKEGGVKRVKTSFFPPRMEK